MDTKTPRARALRMATIVTLCVAAAWCTLLAVEGARESRGFSDSVAAALGTSVFIIPIIWFFLFGLSWGLYKWPEVVKQAAIWAMVLPAAATIWLLVDSLRTGMPIRWAGIIVVWVIVWPVAFGISTVRRLGRKLGHASSKPMRDWADRKAGERPESGVKR